MWFCDCGENAVKRGWQIATLGLLVFSGCALLIGVFGAPFLNARPLPLRDTLGPGPGFFPMWLSLLALTLCGFLLLELRAQPADDSAAPFPVPDRDTMLRLAGLFTLLLLAAWRFPAFPLLEKLGLGSEFVRGGVAALIAAGCALALALWPNRLAELSEEAAVLRIGAVIGLLILAAAALDPLGFRFTALLFTTLLVVALGARSLTVIVPFVLAGSLGVFYVFYHALKVPLPIGPWDHLLKPIETAAIALWSLVWSFVTFFVR